MLNRRRLFSPGNQMPPFVFIRRYEYVRSMRRFPRWKFFSEVSPPRGWQADGKGPSIWDTFCHEEGHVCGAQTGDVTCNSYELWEKDLKCIQQLGLTHYRLSLSWSRLLPDGTTGHVNQKGVQYYNKSLQDRGGWKTPAIASLFDGYARFCFQTFGDRVKLWLTINEPYVCAKYGHEDGVHAPGLKEAGTTAYLAAHNMLRSHVMAWHSYDSLYRPKQGGAVSLAINSDWFEPFRPEHAADVAASDRSLAFTLGWFAWPLFVTGDYPDVMRAAIDAQSSNLGYDGSPRLPAFSEDEPSALGTADFFALNYYTSRKVKHGYVGQRRICMKHDRDTEDVLDPNWSICGAPWLAVVPCGLRKLLNYIKDTFGDPVVYITENGFCQTGPLVMEDAQRGEFYKETIQEVEKAIGEDGVNVRGYFAWSLLDNFEWADGFDLRFGLFHVDFSDPERRRTIYRSGLEYAGIISKCKAVHSK
ncbi:cytosolic beta-glucosidase isoform 3-T3 [Syngnathus typhle]